MAKRLTIGLGLALVLGGALAGCAKERTDADPRGSYALAVAEFVETGLRAMREAGRIPPDGEGLARDQLRSLQFDLELAGDGKFTARMGLGSEVKRYSGTWSRDAGGRIELTQTHEEDAEVADRMTGRQDGDLLRLEHEELGMRMPYVLRRKAHASPR